MDKIKKIVAISLSMILLFTMAIPSFAAIDENTSDISEISQISMLSLSSQIIQLDDGYYLEDEIFEIVDKNTSAISPMAIQKVVSGQRNITLRDPFDDIVWQYSLKGEWFISFNLLLCTYANYSFIVTATWNFSNGDAYFNQNTAYGLGTFKQYLYDLFVIDTVDINITLSCDKNGNLYV